MILGWNRDADTGGRSLQEKSCWISLSPHHNGGRGARGSTRFLWLLQSNPSRRRVFIPGSVDAILLQTPLEGSPAPAWPGPRAAAPRLCWSCSIPASRNKPPAQPAAHLTVEPWRCSGPALQGLAGFCSRFCFHGLFAPASLGGHLRNDREGSALILPDPQCWHRRGCCCWGSLLEGRWLLLGQW